MKEKDTCKESDEYNEKVESLEGELRRRPGNKDSVRLIMSNPKVKK